MCDELGGGKHEGRKKGARRRGDRQTARKRGRKKRQGESVHATTGREEGSSHADRKEGKEISGGVAGPGDACSLGQPEPEP